MARSSISDPVDKFRFKVTILRTIEMTLSSSLVSDSSDKELFNRTGFSEVTIPKANVTEIAYRENTSGQNFIKKPGLVRYEPVILRRGATASKDFYNWYRAVNNDASTINAFTEALAGASAVPVQNPNFRRDILISSVDRQGNFVKHWVIFNAFPISYKGGDDFNASADQKLIEELTLTYEGFVEVLGDSVTEAINNVKRQGEIASEQAVASAAIGAVTGIVGGIT